MRNQIAGHRRKYRILVPAIAAIFLLLLSVFGIQKAKADKSCACTTYAMGTCFQQTVCGKNAQAAAKAASRNICRLENQISWKVKSSDIARLNQAAGTGEVAVQPETVALLRLSLQISKRSGGAFDPAVLPLSSLWDFDDNTKKVPSPADIANAVPLVRNHGLQVNVSTHTASLQKAGMGIDLGGIGKGAACDDVVAAYRSAGAKSGIVSAGGSSIGLYGKKSDGSPWRIAVRDPATPDSNSDAMGVISLDSGFVSTSGIYEKCFTQNGVFYHHLLNPATGYPQNNGLVSVTVIADGGALSDGLSTACFVLGKEKARALLQSYGAGAVFIDRNNKVFVTGNLNGKFEITNSKYRMASSAGS